MILFIGKQEKGFFVEEVGQLFQLETGYIVENADIKKQINKILTYQNCTYMIFDIEQYVNGAEEIADEISKISKVNNAKAIIYASGYLKTSDIIIELLACGIGNYIFATNLSMKKDQLEKCLNGYYDQNGMDELKDIEIIDKNKELESLILSADSKNIGVVGTMQRIGTTTQSVQIIKFLMLNGYTAAYIEMNTSKYVETLPHYYDECEVDKDIGRVKFNNIDMYYDANKIPEILKLNYDFYVYDYGVYDSHSFNKVSFFEKNIKIMVCGIKANELAETTKVIASSFYSDTTYIFSFVSEADRENVYTLMEERRKYTFFASYTPDLFVFGNSNIYKNFINIENKNTNEKKRKGLSKFLSGIVKNKG